MDEDSPEDFTLPEDNALRNKLREMDLDSMERYCLQRGIPFYKDDLARSKAEVKELTAKFRSIAIYRVLEHMVGPGKITLMFGGKGLGKTNTITWLIEFLHRLPHVYFLTNTVFFRDEDDLKRSPWAPQFKPIPGMPGRVAKINPVSNSYEALDIICSIRQNWFTQLTPEERILYRQSVKLPSEPWIVFLLDEANNFMTKMRAMKEDNLIMNSWVDMIRKFGVGMVFIYHYRSEPAFFLDNWSNVDGEITKVSKPVAKVAFKPAVVEKEGEMVELEFTAMPKAFIAMDTNSPASFDAALFPQSRTRFTLASAWKVIQQKQIDSMRAPWVLKKILHVAQAMVEEDEAQGRNIEMAVAANIHPEDGRPGNRTVGGRMDDVVRHVA